MNALDRYIVRLVALPFVAVLIIAAMLMLMEKMLRLFEFVSTEGGPVRIVWQMLGAELPQYISIGLPIALALGVIFAFRGLALSSELDILRAVGLSYRRLLRVPMLFGALLAALNLFVLGWAQPQAKYSYEKLNYELKSGALGAALNVGEFNRFGDNVMLRIEKSQDGGEKLNGIFIRVKIDKKQTLSATADSGEFLRTGDRDTIVLRLIDGTMVHDSTDFDNPRVLTFAQQDLPIDLPRISNFRIRGDRGDEVAEYTLPELYRTAFTGDTKNATTVAAEANFHYRMVEILIMFLVPLLGLTLAVPPKRSSSSMGIFLSVVILVVYHKINEYGVGVASIGIVDPILILWGPFVLFAALIGWLYYQLAYVPGGQPLGSIERGMSKIVRFFMKFLRLFRLWRRKRVVAAAS